KYWALTLCVPAARPVKYEDPPPIDPHPFADSDSPLTRRLVDPSSTSLTASLLAFAPLNRLNAIWRDTSTPELASSTVKLTAVLMSDQALTVSAVPLNRSVVAAESSWSFACWLTGISTPLGSSYHSCWSTAEANRREKPLAGADGVATWARSTLAKLVGDVEPSGPYSGASTTRLER